MFHIFRYLKTPKLTSEFTRITRILTDDYQPFDPHIADYTFDYDFFDSHIADYTPIAGYTPDYRFAAEFLTHPLIPVPAENGLSHENPE